MLPVHDRLAAASAADHLRQQERTWWTVYGAVLAATAALGALAVTTAPRLLPQTVLFVGLGVVVAAARPLAGLHLLTFFTLLGDASILPWYPFAKNLSSRESVFFVDDAMTLSPLELMLVATTVGLLLDARLTSGARLRRGALFVPLLALTGLVVFGLLRSFVGSGVANVAVWEARPLLYLPLTYVLVTNLVRTTGQMVRLFLVAMAGVLGNSLIALNSYRMLTSDQREALQSLNEHGASVHIAALFVLTLGLWLFRGPLSLRLLFTGLTLATLPTFLYSERRAAVVALVSGLVVLAMVLFARSRRTFYVVVPVFLLIAVGYVGAFWGVEEGSAAFPAQAIKGVIAPGDLSEQDQSSNLYRDIEAYNIQFTMRAQPLTGVGFGQPFYKPAPMPDISFFVFWEYVPHNSLLWVWLKTGVFGFIALLFVLGRTIQEGIRSAIACRSRETAAVVTAATAYVVMFTVFAYVDIAWEARSAVFLAIAMAACADLPRAGDQEDVEPGPPGSTAHRGLPADVRAT